jgi:predicted GIY-YIG superfamily endonuclease
MKDKRKRIKQSYYDELRLNNKKHCPICDQIKSLNEFRDGFCIECSREYKRKEYAANKEKYHDRYMTRYSKKEYFVYEFFNKYNQIIYIGKTKALKARMISHFRTDGHLPSECYDNVTSVFYCPLPTQIDMDIYEIYLIDKIRPRFNTMYIHEKNEISNITLPDLQWQEYKKLFL